MIGGGLLGPRGGARPRAARHEGHRVHLMPTLMERQLDEAAGWLLKQALEAARHQTILTGADTEEILGETATSTGVRLKDGREIPADIVVMAVGIRPNAALASAPGSRSSAASSSTTTWCTSDPAILAVGECVEHRGMCYGLVAPLWEMCRALADDADRRADRPIRGSVTLDQAQGLRHRRVLGRRFRRRRRSARTSSSATPRAASTSALVVKDDRIVGAVLYGDTADGGWYFDLLKDGEDIADIRDTLIFGQAFAGGAPPRTLRPPLQRSRTTAEICGCNGVCKGKIAAAIADKGADHPRRGARGHQGVGLLRLVHRAGREACSR